MAKNYLQEGKTLTFIAKDDCKTGDLILMGQVAAIVITDVGKGCAGTGLTEGVFAISKQPDVAFTIGQKVFFHSEKVTDKESEETLQIGLAWENASVGAAKVAVKINE